MEERVAIQIFKAVNKERELIGLPVLTWNPRLTEYAEIRAKEITVKFAHKRPDNTPWYSLNEALDGENIGKGFKEDPEGVLKAWMESESHRANILDPKFATCGISVYVDEKGEWHWVQLFSESEVVL